MSQGINRSLFGFGSSNVDLAPFHPQQVQIFRLWQIYLENVNPLLAVTHTPTLQPRMIDAAGNLSNIPPPLEALMFGIYCVSVLSLGKEDCQSLFGISRDELLKNYQFGCEQALLKCDVLRTEDLDCLVALYLYLVRQQISHRGCHYPMLIRISRYHSDQGRTLGLFRPCWG